MITSINISGFKRFAQQEFQLEPLTVLAGINGSGKTSFIQAILLANLASNCNEGDVVPLNGPYGLQLGALQDVLNWNSGDNIQFDIEADLGNSQIRFDWSGEDDMYLVVESDQEGVANVFHKASRGFTYLSAERYGPRLSLEGCAMPPGAIEVGHMGQHCAQVLENIGARPLDADRIHPDSPPPHFLKYEVERWLSEIAREIELEASRLPGSTIYNLKYRSGSPQWVQATNMGFGVSYSLPIVLAGLTAAKGGILLVENPEAHLHAQGQSKMGLFLAWVAARGVQVVVETHSDHILNGIRRAIGVEKYLSAYQAIVHFFHGDGTPEVEHLRFTELGGVSNWPTGFFDQYQIDTAALGRARRRKSAEGSE